MSRRLNLAAFAFLALVIIGLSALNWRMFSSLEAVAANAEKTNALLLEKLSTLSRSASEDSMTWRKLTVKLNSEDGSPVKGSVSLSGFPFGSSLGTSSPSEQQNRSRVIDPSGVADFGLIHIGQYGIMVTLEGGYSTDMFNVDLMPGENRELSLITPAWPVHNHRVQIVFTPPQTQESKMRPGHVVDNESMWLAFDLPPKARVIDGLSWQIAKPFDSQRQILVNAKGEAFEVPVMLRQRVAAG